MRIFEGIFNRPWRPPPRPPDGPVDGWKTAREALISDPRSAYLKIPPYAVRSAALIDPTLQKLQLLASCQEGERLAAGSPHADNVAPSLLGGVVACLPLLWLDIGGGEPFHPAPGSKPRIHPSKIHRSS